MVPKGPSFGSPPDYEELCRAFKRILPAMPAIDGLRVEDLLYKYDDAGRMQLDAAEVGEFEAQVSVATELEAQGRNLRDYRSALMIKRREMVRDRILSVIGEATQLLTELSPVITTVSEEERVAAPAWSGFRAAVEELTALIGGDQKPTRWGDLLRHVHFGLVGDLRDIIQLDWPPVSSGLRASLYGEHDPLPVGVVDLADVVAARPQGHVTTHLSWAALTAEQFERLIFCTHQPH